MTYEELRDEWEHSTVLRIMVRNVCGSVCYNCGETENIEYHHVVPLKLGGTNNTSNIVALCHRCHCAAHHGRHIRDYCNKNVSGRPRSVNANVAEIAFDLYTSGEIGTNECRKMLNVSKNTKIGDMAAYREYKKKHGIVDFRNYIDLIINKRGFVEEGREIGYIKYENGTVKTIRYR